MVSIDNQDKPTPHNGNKALRSSTKVPNANHGGSDNHVDRNDQNGRGQSERGLPMASSAVSTDIHDEADSHNGKEELASTSKVPMDGKKHGGCDIHIEEIDSKERDGSVHGLPIKPPAPDFTAQQRLAYTGPINNGEPKFTRRTGTVRPPAGQLNPLAHEFSPGVTTFAQREAENHEVSTAHSDPVPSNTAAPPVILETPASPVPVEGVKSPIIPPGIPPHILHPHLMPPVPHPRSVPSTATTGYPGPYTYGAAPPRPIPGHTGFAGPGTGMPPSGFHGAPTYPPRLAPAPAVPAAGGGGGWRPQNPTEANITSVPLPHASVTRENMRREPQQYRVAYHGGRPALWEEISGLLPHSGSVVNANHRTLPSSLQPFVSCKPVKDNPGMVTNDSMYTAALAYSSSRVSDGCVVTDHGILVSVCRITGARTWPARYQFHTERNGIFYDLICIVRDDSVMVQITDETPFTISAGGLWHVKPGQICSVMNNGPDSARIYIIKIPDINRRTERG